ncbi:hypothetical protein TrRE_jg778, partial [Triparma retinervis]
MTVEPSPSTIRALLPTPPILQPKDPLWTLQAPGYECSEGGQSPCDEGYYSNNEQPCQICNKGFMCLGASD